MTTSADTSLELSGRIALRPKEAAAALGISVRTLRQLLPELPHVRRRGVLLFPVRAMERWLEDEARKGHTDAEKLTDEIVRSFHNDSE